jgi:hypothetical protein
MKNLDFFDIMKIVLVIFAIPIAVVLGIRLLQVITATVISYALVVISFLVVAMTGGFFAKLLYESALSRGNESHETAGKTARKIVKATYQKPQESNVNVEIQSPDVKILQGQSQQLPSNQSQNQQLPEQNNKRLVS